MCQKRESISFALGAVFSLAAGSRMVGSAHCTRRFFGGITCNGENSSRFSVAPRRLRFLLRHRKRPPIASARLVPDFGQEPVRPDPCPRAGAARLRARTKSSSRRSLGAKGDMHRVPQLLQEMRADKVEALVVNGFPVALAAKTVGIATVVAFGAGDPVVAGLVKSLSRAGSHHWHIGQRDRTFHQAPVPAQAVESHS
jgi:hypothetical protein